MRLHINDYIKEVAGQIQWAAGLRDKCKPFTPTEAEVKAGWKKLRNGEKLRWGCRLRIYFKEDIEYLKEEFPDDWEKHAVETCDEGILIALPGEQSDEWQDGVVWVPQMQAVKETGDPVWQHIELLCCNDLIAWVEVVE